VAVVATNGWADPDVARAFARARDLCAATGVTPQLFPVLLGLCGFYLMRGEVRVAGEAAAQLLGVAETIGHAAAARSGLVMAAALAAAGRWPADAPRVVPGVPGASGLDRADLVRKVEQSQRIVARSAGRIAGHETEPCPLEHPLVGRLRCGEWLLFAGVHDLIHLEQLHAIADELGAGPAEK